jgi:hypothetical protein
VTAPTPTRTQRLRDAALWCRDSLLGGLGYALVLTVATAGWAASFIGLHDFGVNHMGLSTTAAWLVPITFDGAPAGLSIVVMRASTHGRPATVWRLLIVAFTGLSSWINYMHITDPLGRTVAAFMPPSAVILFEGLMSEARAAAQRRIGRVAPRLHPLRWAFDFRGTKELLRRYILGLPLPAAFDATASPSPATPVAPTAKGASKPASALPAAGASQVPAPASPPRQQPAKVSVPAAPPVATHATGVAASPASASDTSSGRDLDEVAAAYRALRVSLNTRRPSSAKLGEALGVSRSRGQQLRDQLETHPDYAAEFAPALKSA